MPRPVADFQHSRNVPLVCFIVSARKIAWVGTTPSQSAVLREAIRQTIETGKAVAIAVKPKKSDAANVERINLSEIAPDE